MLALIERPFADWHGVWIMPGEDIAALVARATALLDLDDFRPFHGQIFGCPLQSKAFRTLQR